MKNKKQHSIATIDAYNEFQAALNAFNPEMLDTNVTKPSEIYDYYSMIDKLYVWLKNAYECDLLSVENEMRATLGHMAEYQSDNTNLSKAYGHIRRMGIDVLKILCNGFDQEFEEWIITHAEFDYKSQDNLYMPQYVKMYNDARQKYLYAQQKENLGSNKNNHIIEKYYDAAAAYGELYKYHINERRLKIHRYYLRKIWQRRIWTIATITVTAISVIGYFISN